MRADFLRRRILLVMCVGFLSFGVPGPAAAGGPSPPNDDCANALTLNVPPDGSIDVAGSTIGATFDEAPTCVTSNTAPGVWYRVVGRGTTMTASTCNQAEYDTKISVYCNGCQGADGLSCVIGQDDDVACGLTTLVSWCARAGTPYFILVHGFANQVGGFVLTVSDDGGGCTPAVECPVICGNGVIDYGEQCDDGNQEDGDGCSSGCLFELPCGPGHGDCCLANGTPGCADEGCCQAVCLTDAYCCDTGWDDECAQKARTSCRACFVDPCPADTNDDAVIDVVDLVRVVLDWGCTDVSGCPGDVNGDGVVAVGDLVQVILSWGPCCPDALTILSPAPGEVVAGDQLQWVVARLDPAFHLVPVEGSIDVAPQGGPISPIHQGDIRSFSNPDYLLGLWDLAGTPSGPHTITVTAQVGACPAQTASVDVIVNLAPAVDVALVGCAPVPGGTQVTFAATVSDPEEDAIVSLLWEFGDDTPEVVVLGDLTMTHVYAEGVIAPIVKLRVTDARGASGIAWRDIFPELCKATVTTDCGCEKMTITSSAAQSGAYRVRYDGNFLRNTLPHLLQLGCKVVRYNYIDADGDGVLDSIESIDFECPLGATLPSALLGGKFGWGFEITAALTANTNNPARCVQGQLARVTYKLGKKVGETEDVENPTVPAMPASVPQLPNAPAGGFPLVGQGQKYPPFNDPDNKWGPDDYTKESAFKLHEAKQFRWYDSAGIFIEKDHMHVIHRNEFVSFLQGNKGTCWCWIKIEHQWKRPPNGGHQGVDGGNPPTKMTMVMGNLCNVP